MSTLDVCIANYINCHRRELFVKLSDPTNHSKVVQHFEGMRLITAYKNKEGKYKEFVLRDISLKGADEQYAYNGFMGITVKQHYFVRHDFVLRYPVNPCAIEITGKNDQHYNYFPLETVKLATFSPCVSDARRYLTKFIRRPFQKNSEAKRTRSRICHQVNNLMQRHYEQKRQFNNMRFKEYSRKFPSISSNISNNRLLDDNIADLLGKLSTDDEKSEHNYETLSLGTTSSDNSDVEYGPPPDTIVYMDEEDMPMHMRKDYQQMPNEMELGE